MTFTLLERTVASTSSRCPPRLVECFGFRQLHPGDHGGGVTPVPIPNTAVKPSSADGTARAAWWESRTLPGFFVFARRGKGSQFA